jgi:hypothetical protein
MADDILARKVGGNLITSQRMNRVRIHAKRTISPEPLGLSLALWLTPNSQL